MRLEAWEAGTNIRIHFSQKMAHFVDRARGQTFNVGRGSKYDCVSMAFLKSNNHALDAKR